MNNIFLVSNNSSVNDIMSDLIKDFTFLERLVNDDFIQYGDINIYDRTVYSSMKYAKKVFEEQNKEDSLVISVDSAIVQMGEFISFDNYQITDFEKILNGQSYDFLTGVAFISKQKTFSITEITKVYLDEMSDNSKSEFLKDLENSKSLSEVLDKLYMNIYTNKISGDFYNLKGIPINKIKHVLEVHYNFKF